jgi:hypothetical protein
LELTGDPKETPFVPHAPAATIAAERVGKVIRHVKLRHRREGGEILTINCDESGRSSVPQ